MNCRDVRPLLTRYVDGEADNYEQTLIEHHLGECPACAAEVAQLRLTRQRVQREIKSWAASALPPAAARERLLAKLAAEKGNPVQPALPITRPTNRWSTRFRGGTNMIRRFALTGLVTAVMAAALLLTFKNTPTVSAQEILNRAQAAQTTTEVQGILHVETETYRNYALLRKGPSTNEVRALIESYRDYQTGKQRQSLIDYKTGDVGEASGYDGEAIYTARPGEGADGKLIIYRSTRIEGMKEEIDSRSNDMPVNDQQAFEDMQKDPNVQLVGEQAWTTGDNRQVYVLRSKLTVDAQMLPSPTAEVYSVIFFDAQTYRMVESQTTVQQNGKESIAGYTRQLIYEVLPSDAKVLWDLSDLKNAVLVDDPNSDHVDLLPEAITQAELVKRFKSPYMLKTVPDGFTLKITAPPKVRANDDFFLIDYRNTDNSYFLIQASGGQDSHDDRKANTYTTASGLIIHLLQERDTSNRDNVTSAGVDLPDGSHLMIASNLPSDQVKTWIENLVPATE
jgi:hypothetical protein